MDPNEKNANAINALPRPVPKPRPRRTQQDIQQNNDGQLSATEKMAYENVQIDLINKNIIIANENLNEINNNNINKLKNQNKKTFQIQSSASSSSLSSTSSPSYLFTTEGAGASAAIATANAKISPMSPTPASPSTTKFHFDKNILTDLNNLSIDKHKIKTNNIQLDDNNNNNRLKPIPAPRRQQNLSSQEIYGNSLNQTSLSPNTNKITPPDYNVQKSVSSGAISKTSNVTRKAPKVPEKILNNQVIAHKRLAESNNNNIDDNNNNSNNSSNNSDNNNTNISSINEEGTTIGLSNDHNTSSTSLNSTKTNDSLSNGGASSLSLSSEQVIKYNTTSPAELLKSIGTTSKLLSESITERVAVRTKGARHKFDKIQKSSFEFIHTWGSEKTKLATTKLKNVRGKFGADGDDIEKRKDNDNNKIPEFNPDRPHTLPPNDEIFSSISFNSPIYNSTNSDTNLNNPNINNNNIFIYPSLSEFESSYEVPKSQKTRRNLKSSALSSSSSTPIKTFSSNSIDEEIISSSYPCPTYEESIELENKASSSSMSSSPLPFSPSPGVSSANLPFQRNAILTQSMFSTVGARSPIIKSSPSPTFQYSLPAVTATIATTTTPLTTASTTTSTTTTKTKSTTSTTPTKPIKNNTNAYENTIIRKKLYSFNDNDINDNHNNTNNNNNRADSPSASSGEDLPCPNFPAPIFNENIKTDTNNMDTAEGAYGKLKKSSQIKRRPPSGDYEITNIRVKNTSAMAVAVVKPSNDLPNINEHILSREDRFPKIFSRDVSTTSYNSPNIKMDTKIKVTIPEFNTSKSDSWSFYDISNTNNDDSDNESNSSSSIEPIYSNENRVINQRMGSSPMVNNMTIFRQEPLYGLVYENDVNQTSVLQPLPVIAPARNKRRSKPNLNEQEPTSSTSNLFTVNSTNDNPFGLDLGTPSAKDRFDQCSTANDIPMDLLIEFDPLVKTTVDNIISNKSNELILLENLLGEETYGTTHTSADDTNDYDDQSIDISDDEHNLLNESSGGQQTNTGSNNNLSVSSSSSSSSATTSAAAAAASSSLPSNDKKIKSKKNNQLPVTNTDDGSSGACSGAASGAAGGDSDEQRRTVIIHQNSNLRSDSMENILFDEDRAVQPYLINTESYLNDSDDSTSIDLSRPLPSRSNWFIDRDTRADEASTSANLNTSDDKLRNKNLDVLKFDPPSYNEATSNANLSIVNTKTGLASITHHNDDDAQINIQTDQTPDDILNNNNKPKISMKSKISNVFLTAGMNFSGLKRKPSLKSSSKSDVKTLLEMIPRPMLTNRLVLHEGHLIRLPSGVVEDIFKELHARKAYIRDRRFQAYCDKDFKVPKENLPMEVITTIQCVSTHKFSNNSVDIHCFEITTALPKQSNLQVMHQTNNPNMIMTSNNSGNCKTQRVCHLYGVAKESERYIWMQKLLDCMTDVFPSAFTCKYYRAGWCYLKNLITAEWSGAWILLQKQKRKLLYYSNDDLNLECMDLRKSRCLVLKECDDSIKNLHVESGPMLMIDCPPYSMYFMMSSPRETKIWRHIIKEVAHNNGPSLKDQQLTKDDVPVLVDKCINFIYAHGSLSEGVFRKSGSENSINKLLNLFRVDAFSVQITRTEYNEHDVANALKRFMRDLPDRLIGRYAASFISVSEMKSKTEKLRAYKELLMRLPTIEYHTLKKLIGHLNFIQSQRHRNKMGVDNLSMIWGPTLLQDKRSETMQYSQKEANVIADLIVLYKNLYQLSGEEIAKEQIMLNVLQKYHAAAENLSDSVKKSGDLKVWITIDPSADGNSEKDDKQQVNVTLTPTKTVYDVCKELSVKLKKEPHTVTLTEIILNGQLQRPLHYTEKVFDIVINWSYWTDADRKNNYLQLAPLKYLKEVERALKMLPIVTPNKELKFADRKTRSLKSYTLELSDSKIHVMKKEKNAIVTVQEIDLTKTVAYMGCEKKRDFQLRWAITLIDSGGGACGNDINKNILRNRESPFIGHVLAGTNSNDQIVWFSSILHSLYGDAILPNPEIIIP